VAAQAANPETRAKLEQICGELDQILTEIAALEAAGKGNTRAARELAHRAAVKLQELEQEIRRAIAEKV
jgi:tRNA C32,U32 (ribose-2'-O)-methylase TrmJ